MNIGNKDPKTEFKREFLSKTEKLVQDRDKKLETAKKVADFKQEMEKEKEARRKLKEKNRYEETKTKKRQQNIFQNIADFFSGEWSRRKVEEAKERKKNAQINQEFVKADRFEGLTLQDVIAPIDMEIDFNHIQIGERFFRTLFVSGYPRYAGPNWLSPIINFEYSINISTFYYPVDTKFILDKLKRKIGEMEATLYTQMEQRKVVDPSLKVALSDAQQFQDSIAEGTEKFFHFGMYITISAISLDILDKITKNVTSTMASINVTVKNATLQQEDGLISAQPLGLDRLHITRNMDTTSLATTFPFVTSELTMDHGIMYGVNQHNKSLVIFDRFEMENANTVVFAKAGAGKSYFVKLEAVRSLMMGTELIIIDPDREYKPLCDAVDGEYISFSQDKGQKINPFELSGFSEEGDDELRQKILSLEGFIKILVGDLSAVELSIIDRALLLTYREKGITLDPETQKNSTPPLLEDLYKVLKGMSEPEARAIASRLERYIIGSAAGIFNEQSTVELKNPFMVFSIRDLQDELKPMAMYLMLDFIWTRVRKDFKRRILLVDEAWYLMQYPESARFLYSVAKRARKYYLGLTTITQDVDDFLQNELGRAIINNSSIQFLMKQSPNAAMRLQQVFNLSDGEVAFLLSCDKGQGLFFAGSNHVALQVLSSQGEHDLITSDPREVERVQAEKAAGTYVEKTIEEQAQIFEPPAVMKPLKEMVNINEQREMVSRAIAERKQDITGIMEERSRYQQMAATQSANGKQNSAVLPWLSGAPIDDSFDNGGTGRVVLGNADVVNSGIGNTGFGNAGVGNAGVGNNGFSANDEAMQSSKFNRANSGSPASEEDFLTQLNRERYGQDKDPFPTRAKIDPQKPVWEQSLTDQVVADRQRIQQGASHITPQGVVGESDGK